MPSTSAERRYRLQGVNVDPLEMQAAADAICQQATKPHAVYVTKPYVEFLDVARRDKAVRSILNDSWLCLPDGVSLQWAAAYLYGGNRSFWRWLGLAVSIVLAPNRISTVLPERYSGATFSWLLLEHAAAAGLSVYLMGSPIDSSIETTAQAIKKRLPELKILGTHAGELDGKNQKELLTALTGNQTVETELLDELRQLKPDLILIGLGFPIQERLMARLVTKLNHGVLIGEGGTFDYDSFGGKRKRAPSWLRKLGLEWLWRLILEPRRISRQLAIPRFMWAIYLEGRQKR